MRYFQPTTLKNHTMIPFKKIAISMFVFGLAGVFVACSNDDDSPGIPDGEGRLAISAGATYNPMMSGQGQKTTVVELSSFRVNFSEIELEYDGIIDEDNMYGSEDDIELKGPFEIELLSPTPVTFANVLLPNGRLEEIEFEFEKNANPQSTLFNQSMRMEGTINGTPFVFWHDFEEEIEVEFEEGGEHTIILNDENGITIDFDLTTVLDATPTVDLSSAVDGNGNGIIEIGPNDTDGNQALAQAMKQAIKAQIDLYDN